MRIAVTGSSGYVGSVLVPKLREAGHDVVTCDIGWFGGVADHSDFRTMPLEGVECVIHLAAVANDPQGDLDPRITWEINALGTAQLCANAAKAGVKQFIYASSGSVYGISDLPQVTEDAPLVPVSEYNKTKAVAERVCLSYADEMVVQILRPATVCGYSPRQRLDVVVNTLTIQALTKGMMTVLGGEQYRPNLHIEDMCDAYLWMLTGRNLCGVFNVGFENMTVMEVANRVAERTKAAVMVKPSIDPRSYRLNSDKLMATGFRPKRTVKVAIADLQQAYAKGLVEDKDDCYNLRQMRFVGEFSK